MTGKQVLRGPQMLLERSFLCVKWCIQWWKQCLQLPMSSPRGTILPLWPLLAAPLTPYTQAPIEAQHPNATAMRTHAEWLQRHNDDKSHKHCQRHSDSKKHPLKIHPEHVASYFKHSPSPHLELELLWRRLIGVVITFAVQHLFQARNNVRFLYLLWWGHCYLAMPSVQWAHCRKICSYLNAELRNLSFS